MLDLCGDKVAASDQMQAEGRPQVLIAVVIGRPYHFAFAVRIKRNIAGVIAPELRDTRRCRDILHIRELAQRFQVRPLQGIEPLDRGDIVATRLGCKFLHNPDQAIFVYAGRATHSLDGMADNGESIGDNRQRQRDLQHSEYHRGFVPP